MENNNSPLVSVLMTAYNREKYIAEAIESVLESTYTNFELIIVDDNSGDSTVAIAQGFAERDRRIRLYVNEANLKDYPNRNRAASYARGKYIKYLDSDDKIHSWGIGYCVELMEQYPEAGMAMFKKAANKIDGVCLQPGFAIRHHFFTNSFLNIGPTGTIIRRDAFEKEGRFNTAYGAASDKYFNLKMVSGYPLVLLEKEFFFYRVHEGQEINNFFSYLYNDYPLIRDILQQPEMPLTEDEKKQVLAKARKTFIRQNISYLKRGGSVKHVLKAYRHSGLHAKDLLSALW